MSDKKPLRVSRITVHNILGIERLDMEPGGFTTISGPNESGKTSVLNAVRAGLGQGEEVQLLRHGQEKGEIVLLLSDGTKARKSVTAGGGGAFTLEREGKKLNKPLGEVRALLDAFSFNPVEFLTAAPKRRVDVLLESLPAEADLARVETAVGYPVELPRGNALAQLEEVRKRVYDDRTGTNRAVTEKRATIGQLEASLPRAGDGGVEGDPGELEAAIAAAEAVHVEAGTRISAKLDKLRQARDELIAGRQDEITQLQEKIEAARVDIAAERAAFNENEVRATGARRDADLRRAEDQRAPRAALEAIARDRRAAGAAAQTRATISTLRSDLGRLEADQDKQNAALERLDAYKLELLSSLPVPGLEVRDGQLYREGILFERLNKAQQVEIAVEIARLRAGDLGVMCLDDLETLDSAHFEAFKDAALASDLQLFVTRVSDLPFGIVSEDASQGETA